MGTGAINRGISRHHLVVAVVALVVSALLHVLLFTRLESLPLLPRLAHTETRRFVSIEMAEVRMQPPERVTLEREPLDRPQSDLPAGGNEGLAEIAAPEPVRLPLPEPSARPAAPSDLPPPEALPPAMRQEVLAIQDRQFDEAESALPRRWVEADIPRIDQAPDIQLPVAFIADPSGAAVAALADPLFVEDAEAGTPEWSAIMSAGAIGSGGDGEPVRPVSGGREFSSLLDERPDEVSELAPIEDVLQVRVAGHQAADGYTYFALHIERASEKVLPVQPRDVLFIQDSSESMTPWKLDECRRGLKRWLDFLNDGDRFEILGFSDDTTPCFGEWRAYDPASRREAFAFIDGLRAAGNTDVFKSLQSALSIQPGPGRTMLVVLVTDGRPTVGMIGSSEIIENVTRFNRGQVSVFSVGGGKKVNSFFLDLLSYRNRGDAMVVRGDEEIPGAMETWARQLRRPVLTDLSYRFAGIGDEDVYPKQLTHLFLDRPLVIHGRIPAGADRFVFQVIGQSGDAPYDMVFVIGSDQIGGGGPELREQWAWQKIYHLIGDYISDANPEKLETIRAFAETHGLVVPYGFSRALPRGQR